MVTVWTAYQGKFQEARKIAQESNCVVYTKAIGHIVVWHWGTYQTKLHPRFWM